MSGRVRIALVVAVAENGVIGRGGQLPWRLPSDLKHFRRLTLDKPILMGRKTYQSIGRPLDRHDTIVLSRRGGDYPSGVRVAASLSEALALAHALALERGTEEIAVIGGAEVFRAALPRAERIYLTLVHARPEGESTLEPFDPAEWHEVLRREMCRGSDDEHRAEFITFERRGAAGPIALSLL